jgi:hypothetical protein
MHRTSPVNIKRTGSIMMITADANEMIVIVSHRPLVHLIKILVTKMVVTASHFFKLYHCSTFNRKVSPCKSFSQICCFILHNQTILFLTTVKESRVSPPWYNPFSHPQYCLPPQDLVIQPNIRMTNHAIQKTKVNELKTKAALSCCSSLSVKSPPPYSA